MARQTMNAAQTDAVARLWAKGWRHGRFLVARQVVCYRNRPAGAPF